MHGVPAGILVADSAGQCIGVNVRWESIAGVGREEVQGEAWLKAVHPLDQSRIRRLWQETVARGASFRAEYRLRRPTGEVRWVLGEAAAQRGESGGVTGFLSVITDITERKRLEKNGSERGGRLPFLLSVMPAILFTCQAGPGCPLDFVTENVEGKLGFRPEAFLADSSFWLGRVHPDDRTALSWRLARLPQQEHQVNEYRFLHRDGTYRWLQDERSLIRDEKGVPQQIVGSWMDVTDRHRAAAHLEESQSRMQALFDHTMEAILLADDHARYLAANAAAAALLGYPPENLLALSVSEVFETTPDVFGDIWRRLIEVGSQGGECQLRRRDGTKVEAEYRAVANILPGVHLFVIHDITARKQAESELRQSQEQLRALAIRLQDIREQEALRISRELHDELGQLLTGLKMDLRWLEHRICKACLEKEQALSHRRIHEMSFSMDVMIHNLRRICAELRPPVLDIGGSLAFLEWQAHEFRQRYGIACSLELPAQDVALDPQASIALFRIFQEILTNVVRHAAATEVVVRATRSPDHLAFSVSDNGRGIPDDAIHHPESLGLIGMRERALAIGGNLTISQTPGGGATVVVAIPLPRS